MPARATLLVLFLLAGCGKSAPPSSDIQPDEGREVVVEGAYVEIWTKQGEHFSAEIEEQSGDRFWVEEKDNWEFTEGVASSGIAQRRSYRFEDLDRVREAERPKGTPTGQKVSGIVVAAVVAAGLVLALALASSSW